MAGLKIGGRTSYQHGKLMKHGNKELQEGAEFVDQLPYLARKVEGS